MTVVSGIAMAVAPRHLAEVRAALAAIEWADVHYVRDGGQMVATIEAQSTDACMDRLLELQKMPHVLSAEMVEHVFEGEELPQPDATSAAPIRRLEGPIEELKSHTRRGRNSQIRS